MENILSQFVAHLFFSFSVVLGNYKYGILNKIKEENVNLYRDSPTGENVS